MLSKIFTTEGRLNRLGYLKYAVAFSVLSFLLNGILAFVIGNPESTTMYIMSAIVTLPLSIATIMAAIRRLHDLNRSGWFMLITLVPIVNFLFGAYILCFRGTEGPNQYGEDPLAI